MNSQTLNNKIELIQWLSSLEDKSVIDKLIKFKNQEVKDWYSSLSTQEKHSIENGINDAEHGNVSTHSAVRSLYEKWL